MYRLSLMVLLFILFINSYAIDAPAAKKNVVEDVQEVLDSMEMVVKDVSKQKKIENRLKVLGAYKKKVQVFLDKMPFEEKYDRLRMTLYLIDELLMHIDEKTFSCDQGPDIHHSILFAVHPFLEKPLKLPGEVEFVIELLRTICIP